MSITNTIACIIIDDESKDFLLKEEVAEFIDRMRGQEECETAELQKIVRKPITIMEALRLVLRITTKMRHRRKAKHFTCTQTATVLSPSAILLISAIYLFPVEMGLSPILAVRFAKKLRISPDIRFLRDFPLRRSFCDLRKHSDPALDRLRLNIRPVLEVASSDCWL